MQTSRRPQPPHGNTAITRSERNTVRWVLPPSIPVLQQARDAEWRSIVDVQSTYPSADGGVRVASGGRVTIFDVSGNKYRLVAVVVFVGQTVVILDVMTHAEYSRGRWKLRY